MRALVQRVSQASVSVAGETAGAIGAGLLVLLGFSAEDTDEDASYIVGKAVNLRIFADDEGRFNRSALDVGAELLLVSQFTLYADTRRGRRPSFSSAAPPERAEAEFDRAVELFRQSGLRVETGVFQAHMMVSSTNDGPVTIMLDSADRARPRRRVGGGIDRRSRGHGNPGGRVPLATGFRLGGRTVERRRFTLTLTLSHRGRGDCPLREVQAYVEREHGVG